MALTLHGIGTAVPHGSITRDEAVALAEHVSGGDSRQTALLQRIHQRSGVRRRGSVLIADHGDDDSFLERVPFYGSTSPSTEERMDVFQRHAAALALKASSAALSESGVAVEAITHLITVCCTGFEAPGVDLALIERLGLRADVARTHVGFMGCHAALNGLRVARAFAEADADAVVLICCVELCSLHLQYGGDPEQVVANALFADGAAAVVASAQRSTSLPALVLETNGSTVIPRSAGLMHWRITDHGFSMGLSPQVPQTVAQALRPWLDDWLGAWDLSPASITSWAMHPGGPRILTACGEVLELSPEQLQTSRAVLHDHGNMSSATVLFILQRLRHSANPGPCLALAFGPGLCAEAALFRLIHG
ncbi:putative chalcone/stilbene synthase [Synechococcus sp. PROS-7-1]|uniref:type III polyketide synthase n=1 Tax=Synechococcus sp. PROS-7-1 TaxID=1442556 RepID=UPI0016445E1C|nr:type III polyketide synthase [Synechococcus sp. PROS-7-1]QNI84950.1 putative chalcone/stilbene synthase [Synechococcus sp. PROS-7-1]